MRKSYKISKYKFSLVIKNRFNLWQLPWLLPIGNYYHVTSSCFYFSQIRFLKLSPPGYFKTVWSFFPRNFFTNVVTIKLPKIVEQLIKSHVLWTTGTSNLKNRLLTGGPGNLFRGSGNFFYLDLVGKTQLYDTEWNWLKK